LHPPTQESISPIDAYLHTKGFRLDVTLNIRAEVALHPRHPEASGHTYNGGQTQSA
jgi:hypothetical protein